MNTEEVKDYSIGQALWHSVTLKVILGIILLVFLVGPKTLFKIGRDVTSNLGLVDLGFNERLGNSLHGLNDEDFMKRNPEFKATMVTYNTPWLKEYSGWNAFEYPVNLDSLYPDIIIFHATSFVTPQITPILPLTHTSDSTLLDSMNTYAINHNYILIGIAGIPTDNEWIYIREPWLYRYVIFDSKYFAMFMQPQETYDPK